MTKKKVQDEPEPEAVEEVVEAEPEVVDDAPALTLDDAAYGKHIVVDGNVIVAPEGWADEKPRRLTVGGRNVEHTHDLDNGVWCYRSM